MAANLEPGTRYLHALFADLNGAVVELRAINEGRARPSFHTNLVALARTASTLAATHDVYLGVAARRDSSNGTKANLAWAGALFAEVDVGEGKPYTTLAAAQEAVRTFALRPSMVVESGCGLHLYWLLREPWPLDNAEDLAAFEAVTNGLAIALQGDAAWDASRVLRLPGTLWHKEEPARVVELAELDADLRYNLSDFEPWALPPQRGEAVAFTDAEGADAEEAMSKAEAHNLPARTWRLITEGHPHGADRSRGDFAACCALLRADLTDAEIRAVFAHYPIGAKYRQAGEGDRYLGLTIGRARANVDNGDAPPAGKPTPFLPEALDALLAAPDEALDAIIGDGGEGAVLTRGGKGFVAGPTGVGKTNLLLRLSRSLCEGSPFLDLPITCPHTVLYLALEGSRGSMKKRLRKVWTDADPEARQRFSMAFIRLNLANESDLLGLEAMLTEVRPDVLIIDPLRNAHPWDENASQEAARLTALLDALIDGYGCALVLAHHDRKRPPFVRRDAGTDKVRGSTALVGWLQFCLSLDADPKTPDVVLAEWAKTRDAELLLPPLVLDFDRATLDFSPSDRAPGGKVSDDAILNAVYLNGGSYRGPDLVAGLMEGSGASDRWVRERLRALVKDGSLIQYVAPADSKCRALTYGLPDREPVEVES